MTDGPAERNRSDAAEETDVREVRGVLKWFDQTKGYGFITPEDGSSDIMLHSSCLRSAGLAAPPDGTEITCEAVKRAKGLQAVRVLRISGSARSMVAARHDGHDGADDDQAGPMRPVTVKWFSRAKGYGFLQEDGHGEDIFIHMETVRAAGFTELETGQRVDASTVRGPKGLLAKAIAPHRAH